MSLYDAEYIRHYTGVRPPLLEATGIEQAPSRSRDTAEM